MIKFNNSEECIKNSKWGSISKKEVRRKMDKAMGMLEYKTVSTGILAADLLVKQARVEIVKAQIVCPGKYIIIFRGEIGAIQGAIETVKITYPEKLLDSFLLGNPHESIFSAIYGRRDIKKIGVLGILETRSAAAIFVAADEAVKTADIRLIKIRVASGMCGKSYVFLTGEVAAVQTAVKRARLVVNKKGMYLDSSVLANLDEKLWETLC